MGPRCSEEQRERSLVQLVRREQEEQEVQEVQWERVEV